MKKFLVLLLSATTVFSLVACGKNASATSEVSNTTNETVAEKPDETEIKLPTTEESQLNNEANEGETEDQEPEESSSPEVSTQIDFEDYFEGNTWNLTAYAEALGYEWIPDPEYEGVAAMYAIENNGIKYFFYFRRNSYSVFYSDMDGRCWSVGGDSTIDLEFCRYSISLKGQALEETTMEMIERVSTILQYLKYEDADGQHIPGHNVVSLYDGAVSYYENGMIRQRDFGEVIESRIVDN